MTTNDSTTVTFSQVYNDVKGAIDGLADALKVGAQHVYEVLVLQQYVNSITLLLVCVMLFSVGGIVLRLGIKNMYFKNKYEEKEVKDEKIPLIIVGSLILISALIFTSVNISTILTGFFNPEYGAIMEIKSFVK